MGWKTGMKNTNNSISIVFCFEILAKRCFAYHASIMICVRVCVRSCVFVVYSLFVVSLSQKEKYHIQFQHNNYIIVFFLNDEQRKTILKTRKNAYQTQITLAKLLLIHIFNRLIERQMECERERPKKDRDDEIEKRDGKKTTIANCIQQISIHIQLLLWPNQTGNDKMVQCSIHIHFSL